MIQKITDKREKILEAAEKLFQLNGFHATGVDPIASEANVTKRTLYKYFGSKEGLIKAVLLKHQDQMMQRVRSRVSKIDSNSVDRLLVCFDLYQEWFSEPSFAGCIFIKTLNEFRKYSGQLVETAQRAKSGLRNYLAELAEAAGAKDPKLLASQLQIILDGSIVVAQCGRESESIRIARKLAETIVAENLSDCR